MRQAGRQEGGGREGREWPPDGTSSKETQTRRLHFTQHYGIPHGGPSCAVFKGLAIFAACSKTGCWNIRVCANVHLPPKTFLTQGRKTLRNAFGWGLSCIRCILRALAWNVEHFCQVQKHQSYDRLGAPGSLAQASARHVNFCFFAAFLFFDAFLFF